MNSDIEFIYIGWCKGTNDGVQNDKVWTAFKAGNTYYAGWGARGKAIRFKQHNSRHELETVMRRKQKDYNEVDEFQLFAIFPTFKDDVSSKLLMSILSETVM